MPRLPWLDRIFLVAAEQHARRTLRRFLDEARSAQKTQQRILLEKLRRHAPSDFGRRHSLNRIHSPADLAAALPITDYEFFSPYIERLKNGETTALLGPSQRVLMFALTSGTTHAPKYIPVTTEFLAEYKRGWNCWGLRALLDHPGSFLRHIVQVSSPMDDQKTPSGIPCGAITGLMAATQKRLVRKYYTAPLAVAHIADSLAKYYTIMRLSIPHDVAFLIAANPATLLLLAQTANDHRESLIRDIHDGTLSSAFEIPAPVRSALQPRCIADPARAKLLDRLASQHGALRPRDYWNLAFLAHWTGGTMGLYRTRFPAWFGDVPVRDPGLLASEGRMSIPIDDNTAAGILDVSSHFFEFIPAEDYDSPSRRAVTIADVAPGREYFLVLTTSSGLFRYDIGDRVRVTGFFGEAPIVEFLSKGAHTSSLAGEKLTEHQVIAAMKQLNQSGGLSIENFVLAPHWAEPPAYKLYYESPLNDTTAPAVVAQHLDETLARINLEYASKRDSHRLGAVQPFPLPAGFLAKWDQALRRRQPGRAEQFKHVYLLSECGLDDAMLSELPIDAPSAPAGKGPSESQSPNPVVRQPG